MNKSAKFLFSFEWLTSQVRQKKRKKNQIWISPPHFFPIRLSSSRSTGYGKLGFYKNLFVASCECQPKADSDVIGRGFTLNEVWFVSYLILFPLTFYWLACSWDTFCAEWDLPQIKMLVWMLPVYSAAPAFLFVFRRRDMPGLNMEDGDPGLHALNPGKSVLDGWSIYRSQEMLPNPHGPQELFMPNAWIGTSK